MSNETAGSGIWIADMPITAIIKLRAQTAGKVSRSFHCLMLPVFLDRLAQADPAMSSRLHDSQSMSPFSLSPVMGVHTKVQENQSCWVRIGILNDELQESFVNTLEQGVWHQPIQLEEHIFQIENILWGHQADHPWSGYATFESLLTNTEIRDKLSLRIKTPLSFKRSDTFYPFPEPSLLFRNILTRWNAFSLQPFTEAPDFSRISFSHFNIKTRPYPLRHGATAIGCVGDIGFLFKQCSQETTAACQTLLRFAFYAGIGIKTTQGMGMVSLK